MNKIVLQIDAEKIPREILEKTLVVLASTGKSLNEIGVEAAHKAEIIDPEDKKEEKEAVISMNRKEED